MAAATDALPSLTLGAEENKQASDKAAAKAARKAAKRAAKEAAAAAAAAASADKTVGNQVEVFRDGSPDDVSEAKAAKKRARKEAARESTEQGDLKKAKASAHIPVHEQKKAKRAKKKAEKAAAAGGAEAAVSLGVAAKAQKRSRSTGEDDEKSNAADNVKKRRVVPSEATTEAPHEVAEEVKGHLSGADFCKKHQMQVSGPKNSKSFVIPEPMVTFESTPFDKRALALFKRAGFEGPTVTQAMAWPLALKGQDIVSVAKTGSGKTLGFLMPVFHQLSLKGRNPYGQPVGYGQKIYPVCVVLAPTRELAMQSDTEANKFGAAYGFKSTCVYGGAPKSLQSRALRAGVDVVVATPGRMQDFMDMGVIDLSRVDYLILDEADRMLDMGFEEVIRYIISFVPTKRQTFLFSATWPKSVERIAAEFAPSPVQMSLGDSHTLQANKSVTQIVEMVSGETAKTERLCSLLDSLFMEDAPAQPGAEAGAKPQRHVRKGHGKAIVFCKFKANCNGLAQIIWDAGFHVNTLHGDMDQNARTRVIQAFKRGEIHMLVATDVAARGLDVKDVTNVINYDFPAGRNGVEDFVHRIGRTGRAGQTGTSHTFFCPREDKKNAVGLIKVMRDAKQPIPEELAALARPAARGRAGNGGGGRGRGGKRGYGGGGSNRRWY